MYAIQTIWEAVLSIPLSTVLFIVLGCVIVALAVLAVLVIQLGTRLRYLATPIYDKTVHEAEEKAEHLLAEAREQAMAIRANAEAQANRIMSGSAAEEEKFRAAQASHLEEITVHAKEVLRAQALAAEKALSEKAAQVHQTLAEEDARITRVFTGVSEKAEREFQTVVAQVKKRIDDEATKEIAAARTAVVQYRQEQLARINNDIVRLVEDTARIALHKSLSLADHRDVVLAALAEAKQQGMFGSSS